MDKSAFAERVMQPLEAWSNAGDVTNEAGTRLIGHMPEIAPKAFMHLVYAPLSESELLDLTARLGTPLPAQLKQFLCNANGLSIFLDDMRVFGYVPVPAKRRVTIHVHHFSTDLVLVNVSARVRGLDEGAIAVGRYRIDGSYVSINEDGTANRFDPRGGAPSRTWPDFDTWLVSEIAAMSQTAFQRLDSRQI